MTSGEDWHNDPTNIVKEEGDSESTLVDVESHDELPNMKQESFENVFKEPDEVKAPLPPRTPLELREWLKHFKSLILAPVSRNSKSTPFKKPVDAVALGIYPIYFQIIKKPMDLGTVRQKVDTLQYATKEEAISELMLVWDNATTFNTPEHPVHQAALELKAQCQARLDKLEREGIPPPSTPKSVPAIHPKRESHIRRDARKKSFDLPGEIQTPQHLEQKYVGKLSSSLKACDGILKNLMTMKQHRDYVEPFLQVERKTERDTYEPMSLTKIQQRMRNLYYNHPMDFADDMRRIVTETYRYCHPDDPLVVAAAKLQQEFEMLFAKINFQENELVPPILTTATSQLSEDDEYISKLLSAQNFMVQIQTDLTNLIRDYMQMKKRNKKRKNTLKPGPSGIKSVPAHKPPKPKIQGQFVTRTPSVSRPMPPPAKKPRVESRPQPTLEEATALKEKIAELDPQQQFKILEIMQSNGERVEPDENGEIEIEIAKCSTKTVSDIRIYIDSIKAKKFDDSMNTSKELSDSSSESDSSSDDSSSDDSSDSSSDSDSE